MVKTNKIKKRYITSLAYRSTQLFTITLGYTMSQMLNFYGKKNALQSSHLISNIMTNISDTHSVSSTMINSHHE
jgi:hypothetical protein